MLHRAQQRLRHDQYISYAELHRRELSDVKELLGPPIGMISEFNRADCLQLMYNRPQKHFLPTSLDTDAVYRAVQTQASSGSSPHDNTKRKERRRHQFEARFRAPHWLIHDGRAWELFAFYSPSSWKFTFRTYNVVPAGSPVLEYLEQGDIAQIQKLFTDGKASPFDRDPNNFTLLDVRCLT
jgi:hypothetical protein